MPPLPYLRRGRGPETRSRRSTGSRASNHLEFRTRDRCRPETTSRRPSCGRREAAVVGFHLRAALVEHARRAVETMAGSAAMVPETGLPELFWTVHVCRVAAAESAPRPDP